MMFSKWMVFLTSIVCAIYSIAPDEINFESFSSKNGGIGNGNDTEEKLASSKDKGLRPLLSYFENVFSDFIVADFSDKYVFRFTGMDEEDEKQKFEEDKLVLKVNEMRAARGYDKVSEPWGEAPLNPSLIGVWQASQQQDNEDYGQPPETDEGDGAPPGGKEPPPEAGQDEEPDDNSDTPGEVVKSFGLPVYEVEA